MIGSFDLHVKEDGRTNILSPFSGGADVNPFQSSFTFSESIKSYPDLINAIPPIRNEG